MACLVGDVSVAAAMCTYLGPFHGRARAEMTAEWLKAFRTHGLRVSRAFSLTSVLGDPIEIGEFERQGDDENCLPPIPIAPGAYVYVGVDILEDSAVVGLGDVVPDGASPASRPV